VDADNPAGRAENATANYFVSDTENCTTFSESWTDFNTNCSSGTLPNQCFLTQSVFLLHLIALLNILYVAFK